MPDPSRALTDLAAQLRAEESVISGHVTDPVAEPTLGLLAAAGPRAAEAPWEYALVVEAVREGYLLHYGEPRIVTGADTDLGLLAGDYLYALGLERLTALGASEAVAELADLISLEAQLHSGAAEPDGAEELWLAATVAIAAGSSDDHEAAKRALRNGEPAAPSRLAKVASDTASANGLGDRFRGVAEAIDFRAGGTA